MPRVLWLFELPALHGAERSLLACLPGVRAAGFEIVSAAPSAGPVAEALAAEQVPHWPLDVYDARGQRHPPERLHAALREIVAKARPDVVHANSLAMGRSSAAPLAAARLPSIAHLRDIVRMSQAAISELNRHTRLLAVSQATRAFHIAQGLDADLCHVLYNGVDLARFAPQPATGWLHRELALDPKCPLVGSIGQIGLRKGQDTLVAAFIEIAAARPDVHLVVVGQRTSQKAESQAFELALHERLAAAGLTARAHFVGLRNDVARLLPELAVVAHAARQEPLGRVLLEAGACGRPIVATRVGGTPEIFPDESGAATLVPPDDPHALAQALLRLVADSRRAATLGEAARERIAAAFDLATATAGLCAQYRDVASTARPAPETS